MANSFRNPHPLIGKSGALLILRRVEEKLEPHPGTLVRVEQNENFFLRATVMDEADGELMVFLHSAIRFVAPFDGPEKERLFTIWATTSPVNKFTWYDMLQWRSFYEGKKAWQK